MGKDFKLALTLHGHSADVRYLNVPDPTIPLLLSSSRDGSAIVWGPSNDDPKQWDAKLRVEELERNYVSCVTLVRYEGQAYLLIGSSTGLLSSYILPSLDSAPPAFDAPTLQPHHTLIEHRQNLCSIDSSKGGLIATGSWDKTVIVWKDFKKAIQIETHTQAVWAVKFVGEDRLLTASADKTITLHAIDVVNGKSHPLQTYTGHSQPVRGLSLRPDGTGFWSCANDSLVNVYSFDKPAPVHSLSGHTSFVYSVSAFPDGSGAVSAGEDGALRVWSETELVQTINHPTMSLWSSAVVPARNGSEYYVASAAADTTIRFFTRSEDLEASLTEQEVWNNEVAQRKLDKSQVGDVKHSDLPGMEALARPGKSDGQVIMIKNNDQVEAYQWSQSETTWQQVGQVVDAIGSGRKQLYDGKEWDYVFDVHIAEGVPPLKLPYKVSENPFIAAQRFLEKNELSSGYIDQVVDFIHKNTGGVQLGTGGGGDTFVDPFTGASRYTGGGVSTGSTGGSDPFTGGSRYTGGGVSTGSAPAAYYGGADPLTGGSSYTSTPAPITKILPIQSFLSFKKINAAAAKGKVDQFNTEIKASNPNLAIDDARLASLNEAIFIVSSDKVASSESYDPKLLLSLAVSWDAAHRFPLVDILRVLALQSPAFGAVDSAPADLLKAGGWGEAWAGSKPQVTNQLLALRAIANLYNTETGRSTVANASDHGLLKELIKGRTWEQIGTAKQPFATVVLNHSVLAVNGKLPSSQAAALLSLIVHVLSNEVADSETIYRAAVALGNLLSSPISGSLAVGEVQRGKDLVSSRGAKLGEKRLTDLATEIGSLGA
ncbi:Phospholipase A-2-activating protein [Vanrija pseudolonga]|uniref:Phospholipase A-2-activating protein n=1 Tax=Vanrija pseudolonga TaxID=143232 RepID=A0AAF0YCA5_9TREE|nr:Phospholipase A-2-activating protein [Vanrija pseudolonga]